MRFLQKALEKTNNNIFLINFNLPIARTTVKPTKQKQDGQVNSVNKQIKNLTSMLVTSN